MKIGSVLFAVASMAIILGCGGNDGTATSADTSSMGRVASGATQAQREADYPVPSTPPQEVPLKELVVKNLEKGKGPMAHWGDEVTIRYVGAFYETGTVFVQQWELPESLKLNGKKYGPGLQRGIEGMRVGGQREILIPSALYFGGGDDAAYVVALDKVKHGATG